MDNVADDVEGSLGDDLDSEHSDRVHPGHARKMAAKMMDLGHKVYYYENTEGGHGGSSTNEQKAKFYALYYSYLWMKLKV